MDISTVASNSEPYLILQLLAQARWDKPKCGGLAKLLVHVILTKNPLFQAKLGCVEAGCENLVEREGG